jgi:hypothetical protein
VIVNIIEVSIATIGFGIAVANAVSATKDAMAAGGANQTLKDAALASLMRVSIYGVAQLVVLVSLLLEFHDPGPLAEMVELRALLLSGLVLILSVHDRVTREILTRDIQATEQKKEQQ